MPFGSWLKADRLRWFSFKIYLRLFLSLNCGNSSPFIINRFLLKLFNSGCLKKLNYWGIALKAYAKLHLNNECINIPWPLASTQIFCEPHKILKHNFSLSQCRREKKRVRAEKNWPHKLSPSLPSLHEGFSRFILIRSLHYPGDWNRLSKA